MHRSLILKSLPPASSGSAAATAALAVRFWCAARCSLLPGSCLPAHPCAHAHLYANRGVPAGVLYDLVAAPGSELPWQLTLHFRGFPDR